MKWLRRLRAYLTRSEVAKPPPPIEEVKAKADRLLSDDVKGLRQYEIIVRRRPR